MAQQPPQGYGPPPGYQQGYPQQGYAPPPKPGMGIGTKILIAVGAVTLLGMGTCATCAVVATGGAAKAVADAEEQRSSKQQAAAQGSPEAAPAPAANAEAVELKTLLSEYKDNEVRADAAYKGKLIRLTGKVGDIKKDILNHPYVTVGSGAQFEFPTVQCMLDDSAAGAAMQLSKGTKVTVQGSVKGLMMNVLLDDCVIVP